MSEFEIKSISHDENNCGDLLFYLGEIKELFQVEELIEGSLWVAHDFNPDEDGYGWMHFYFFEFHGHVLDSPDQKVELTLLMHGGGPVGVLKECRHTYWGKDGYIFYPDATHIRASLEWLEKYYEMT